MNASTQLPRWGWLLVIGVATVVCCFELGDARALTEHEIVAAGGAKQMAVDGDWLFPKIGNELWIEKPPLLHWLIVLSGRVFGGFTETAVRLPSALAGITLVALITSISARWFGAEVAIVAGVIQATTVYFITYARLAEADMILALIVVAALCLFVRLHSIGEVSSAPRRHAAMLFWALVGLSNQTKGPGFGALLILAPCVGFLIWKRDVAAWRRMISWPGFALALALGAGWQVYIAVRNPEARELWRTLIIERATTGAGFTQPWWYYLGTWAWQLLPWTGALLLAAGPSLRRALQQRDAPDRFLWCWAIIPIVLLSFSKGKHHHYIISCLCAFSPLIALGLLRLGKRVAIASTVLAVFGCLYVHARVLPARDPARHDREFLRSVRSSVPDGVPLFAIGGIEIARHIFYVDPPPEGLWIHKFDERLRATPAFFAIARRSFESQLAAFGRVSVVTQSVQTRKERSPADRFTLFHVEADRSLQR